MADAGVIFLIAQNGKEFPCTNLHGCRAFSIWTGVKQ